LISLHIQVTASVSALLAVRRRVWYMSTAVVKDV